MLRSFYDHLYWVRVDSDPFRAYSFDLASTPSHTGIEPVIQCFEEEFPYHSAEITLEI